MSIELVVRAPFGPYVKGDHITDPLAIAKVLAERPQDVIKISAQKAVTPQGQVYALPAGPEAPAAA